MFGIFVGVVVFGEVEDLFGGKLFFGVAGEGFLGGKNFIYLKF